MERSIKIVEGLLGNNIFDVEGVPLEDLKECLQNPLKVFSMAK